MESPIKIHKKVKARLNLLILYYLFGSFDFLDLLQQVMLMNRRIPFWNKIQHFLIINDKIFCLVSAANITVCYFNSI